MGFTSHAFNLLEFLPLCHGRESRRSIKMTFLSKPSDFNDYMRHDVRCAQTLSANPYGAICASRWRMDVRHYGVKFTESKFVAQTGHYL